MFQACISCISIMHNWFQNFPLLARLDDGPEKNLLITARPITWGSGEIVFHAGAPCHQYLLVLEGQIRVQQTSATGREIVLYRIGPGESCILTTACLFSHRPYPAMGITESAVRAVSLSQSVFERLVAQSGIFREFVFNAYGNRLTDLLALVEEVVFTRLDVRLAKKLLELGGATPFIQITHQALATPLDKRFRHRPEMGLSTIVRTPQFIKDRASGHKVTDYLVSATIEAIKPSGCCGRK